VGKTIRPTPEPGTRKGGKERTVVDNAGMQVEAGDGKRPRRRGRRRRRRR
jgi:hypothetical protein